MPPLSPRALIGALSLRTSGFPFVMITLALSQMVYFIFVSLKIYGGDDGMSMRGRNTLAGFSFADATTYYYLCLVLFLLFLLLCRRIVASRFGLVLRGCKDNERRVRSLGYPTYGYRLVAFTIAGAGAGLAGGLLVNLDRFASPDMLQWQNSGNLMVMVILGGIGSLFGPALGAVLVICARDGAQPLDRPLDVLSRADPHRVRPVRSPRLVGGHRRCRRSKSLSPFSASMASPSGSAALPPRTPSRSMYAPAKSTR